MVEFNKPITPASQATNSLVTSAVVVDVDQTNRIAHVRDRLGNIRKVSLNFQMGKSIVYPQPGEQWLISREYGDWIFAVSQNVAPLGSVTAQPNTVMLRDGSGRSQTVTPSAANDIVNKSYVDAVAGATLPAGGVAGALLQKNSSTNYDTSWLASSSSGTASTAMVRDANGRSQVVDPAASQDIGTKHYIDTAVAAVAAVPTGSLAPFAGSAAPTGYFLCNGQAVSRTTYATLFGIIGTTYGTGDGSTTFNVPNLLGKVVVGMDAGETEFATLGQTGGEKTHVLTQTEMPSHTHTQNSHTHGVTFNSGANPASTQVAANASSTTSNRYMLAGGVNDWSATATTATNQNTGGGAAHNNLQPYMALNYIIKY